MIRKHRMPAGGPKGGKDSTETAEQAATEDSAVADQAAPETVETADAAVKSAPESEETMEAPVAESPDTADAEAASDSVDAEPTESAQEPTESADESADESDKVRRKIAWSRVFAYGVLPGLALLLALAAGFARWEYVTSAYGAVPPVASEENPSPATESMNAAKDSTIKMLSYKPDTVDQELNAARDLLTGDFRDSYTSLINDVVIPGAQQKQISAVASVPAAASVSADPKHAVVLVFVNQTVVVGQDLPSDTASSVRVTLEKVGDRWLISEFEPV